MCLYPKLIDNPKYKKNAKNGGKPPTPTDIRTLYVPIGCGNCIECRKAKQREWQVRLLEEIKQPTQLKCKFVTLTFSDRAIKELSDKLPNLKGYTLDNAIATLATRLYLERQRKATGKSLRHWLVTELGHNGTKNIHLHGLIWYNSDEEFETAEQRWQYGHIWKGYKKLNRSGRIEYENYVNETTVAYMIKYVSKMDHEHQYYKPVILTSAGIGRDYIKDEHRGNWRKNKYNGKETDELYRTRTGHRIKIPIYYRNKLYNDQQREQLWLYKLDEQTRYVLGRKFDISQTTADYEAALQEARMKNIRLGYGSDEIDRERKLYESRCRILMQETRKKKGTKPCRVSPDALASSPKAGKSRPNPNWKEPLRGKHKI